MEPCSFPSYQEAEQRLGWLRELAVSLQQARAAVLSSDPRRLALETARQRELCAALGQSPGLGSCTAEQRWNSLLRETIELEIQVFRLNREYGALLARAQRTVKIFCRVLANSQATYLPPEPEPSSSHWSTED